MWCDLLQFKIRISILYERLYNVHTSIEYCSNKNYITIRIDFVLIWFGFFFVWRVVCAMFFLFFGSSIWIDLFSKIVSWIRMFLGAENWSHIIVVVIAFWRHVNVSRKKRVKFIVSDLKWVSRYLNYSTKFNHTTTSLNVYLFTNDDKENRKSKLLANLNEVHSLYKVLIHSLFWILAYTKQTFNAINKCNNL